MLRPSAHPVTCCWMLFRVVVQNLKPVKLLAPCKQVQPCWPTSPDIVGSRLRPFACSVTLSYQGSIYLNVYKCNLQVKLLF